MKPNEKNQDSSVYGTRRVLHLFFSLKKGGGETVVSNLLAEDRYVSHKHRFWLVGEASNNFLSFCEDRSERTRAVSFRVPTYSRSVLYWFLTTSICVICWCCLALRFWRDYRSADVIQVYCPRGLIAVWVFRLFARKPIIFYFLANSRLLRRIIPTSLFLFKHDFHPIFLHDKMQAYTSFSKEYERLGITVDFVPGCVRAPSRKHSPIIDRLQDDRVGLVHIGRYVDVKRHADILKAFKLLRLKHPQLSIKFFTDKYFLDEAVNGAEIEVDRPDNVLFSALNSSAIFVFFSDNREGFPMVLLEALMAGIPIVSSRVGLFLEHEYPGVVEVGNFEAFLDKIDLFLSSQQARSLAIEKGYEILESYSAESVAEKFATIYSNYPIYSE